jgi:hypothetical protein
MHDIEVHLTFGYKMEPLCQCYGRELICPQHPEVREAPRAAQLCYGQCSHRGMGEQVSNRAIIKLAT